MAVTRLPKVWLPPRRSFQATKKSVPSDVGAGTNSFVPAWPEIVKPPGSSTVPASLMRMPKMSPPSNAVGADHTTRKSLPFAATPSVP